MMKARGRKLAWALGLLALAGAATLLRAAEKPEARHPSLAGTWTLNEDLTARMRENDQQGAPHGGGFGGGGMGRRGGGRGGGRRGGGGFPGGGSPGGAEGAGGEPRETEEGQRPNFAALDTLTITQTGNQVTVADKEGHTRVFRADGGKVRDDKAFGGPAEVQASWDQDGGLVVRVKPDKGPKRTESYIVSDDGKHLYIVLTVEGDRGSRKIRRAYDPAVPEEKTPAPPADPEETEIA
jgi:hypothetical protein